MLPHYDLLCITETWLNDKIDNSELGLFKDYYAFRADRTLFSSVKGSGGGVILAVNKKFNCVQLTGDNSIDQVFVKIWLKDFCMLVGLLYIPPLSPLEKYISAYDLIQELVVGDFDDILILGDFNLPGYLWYDTHDHSYMSGSNLNWVVREAAQHMNNFCEIFKFHQLNKNLNGRGNVLDLVLSNKKIVNVNTRLGL